VTFIAAIAVAHLAKRISHSPRPRRHTGWYAARAGLMEVRGRGADGVSEGRGGAAR
jgi:hypothetical protein